MVLYEYNPVGKIAKTGVRFLLIQYSKYSARLFFRRFCPLGNDLLQNFTINITKRKVINLFYMGILID